MEDLLGFSIATTYGMEHYIQLIIINCRKNCAMVLHSVKINVFILLTDSILSLWIPWTSLYVPLPKKVLHW